eukprot:6470052-Prymnesium_polylepis.1
MRWAVGLSVVMACPRKLEMRRSRRSRFSGTTDSSKASLQIASPIRGGFQQGSNAQPPRARRERVFGKPISPDGLVCANLWESGAIGD